MILIFTAVVIQFKELIPRGKAHLEGLVVIQMARSIVPFMKADDSLPD
jgi:hypothetical protein